VPRFPLACAISKSLIATAILCVSSLSALSADRVPTETSALSNKLLARCASETSGSAAKEQQSAAVVACEASTAAEDRAYLLATASPGDTMMRQGAEVAIGRLNPEFVTRLANAVREAREEGLPSAGVMSAYRPPGFGIGGFADKFNSLHAYGLAVDMTGIGEPGSKETKLWHAIAGKHGVICPYGPDNRKEWNHCQATGVKKVSSDNPLRETITAQGPRLLDEMFKVGNSVIDELAKAISVALGVTKAEQAAASRPAPVREAAERTSTRVRRGQLQQTARAGRRLATKAVAVAKLEVPRAEKSRRKAPDDAKTHGQRKLQAASAESRQGSARRRSRSASTGSSANAG
jgi:hypothetical protein